MGNVEQPIAVQSPWHYLDYLQVGVMIVDERYRIVFWNRWLENHSNIVSESIEQQPFKAVFPELEDSRLFELIQQVIEERLSGMISSSLNQSLLPLYPSINHQLKQMDLMRQMVQVTAMEDVNGRQMAMVQITDMTRQHLTNAQMKAQSREIQAMIDVDTATALANRQKFDVTFHQEYRRAIRSKTALVVSIIELDFFDTFTRHYGKSTADKVLAEVSSILVSLLCRETDLIARYNPQSLGVILPATTEEGAVMIAQEARRAVRELEVTHAFSAAGPSLSVSIGMAYAEPNHPDGEEALAKATEFALNSAREHGGDRAMLYRVSEGRLYDCDGGLDSPLDSQLLLQM